MLGGFLSLLSAATFAFSNVAARRGVITGTVFQALAITVPIGVPLFFIAALVAGSLPLIFDLSWEALTLLASAGVAHFVWGRYFNYRAINAMGSNLVAPIQQSSLLISLSLAVWLLGESLTPLRLLGIACVVLGPAIMVPRRRKPGTEKKTTTGSEGFQPRYGEGYSFAIISVFGYGTSPLLVRAALLDTSPAAGLAGGLISYTAAAIVVAAIILAPGPRRDVQATEREAGKWFTISGVFVCVSQMLRYMALTIAPVTVVTPIQRTTLVFRVLFSWIINRDHEIFGFRVYIGMLFSVLGAVALTLSTEFILANVSLPDQIIEIVRWQWPQY